MRFVIGGVNLHSDRFYISKNKKGANALCVARPSLVEVDNTNKNIKTLPVKLCTVVFMTAADLTKRGLDPRNSNDWMVEGMLTTYSLLYFSFLESVAN